VANELAKKTHTNSNNESLLNVLLSVLCHDAVKNRSSQSKAKTYHLNSRAFDEASVLRCSWGR
jgi:hypothetical protein